MLSSRLFLLALGLQFSSWCGYTNLLAAPIGGSGLAADPNAKTNFEVVVTSTTEIDISGDATELTVGGTNVGAGTVTNNQTKAVTITWITPIPAATLVEWAFKGEEATTFNKYSWKVQFTPHQSPTDLPSLGWDVTPSGDVSLTNAYSTSIAFSGLVFQQPVDMTIDSLLALVQGPAPGIPATVSAGLVPADSELFVGHVVLPPGGILTADYSSSFIDPSFSLLTMTGGLGHRAVPEPSTWLLLATGLVGLLGYAWRQRKKASGEKWVQTLMALS